MADAKKQLKELNDQIDALYKRLGRMDTPPVFKPAEIGAARREIKKLKEDLDEVNNSLSFISKSFRDSIAELSKQNTELGYAKRSLKNIEKIAREISYENSQGLLIDDKKLDNVIKSTQFNNMQKLEKEVGFKESVLDKKTNKKKPFFNLGPSNNWKNTLDLNLTNKIEKTFSKEMEELGYL